MKDATLTAVSEFHKAFEIEEAAVPLVMPKREIGRELELLEEMQREVARWAHDAAKRNGKDMHLLRVQLMAEELAEVIQAMANNDTAGTLHELADLRYVCDGTALTLGLGDLLVPATLEIHRANMSKLGDDGKPVKDAAGRVMKGPRFQKADIKFLLRSYTTGGQF